MNFVDNGLPDEGEGNVNVSHTHPLKEFVALVGGLVLVVAALTFILGFFITLALPWISPKLEAKIFSGYANQIVKDENLTPKDSLVHAIFDSCVAASNCEVPLTLIIAKDSQINAFAVPGGIVVLNEGLLNAVESENELAFVVGHEIGHFHNRDHLRGLGYAMAFSLVTSIISNGNADISSLINSMGALGSQRYSQHRETKADEYGLRVLNNTYGHCGGATDLFTHLKEDGTPQFLYLFSTHPTPDQRISSIRSQMLSLGFVERSIIEYDRDGELPKDSIKTGQVLPDVKE